MQFKRDELQIKIGSLADESRLIRRKEQTLKYKAFRRRTDAIVAKQGITGANGMPPELASELERRARPMLDRANGNPAILPAMDKVARKVIRKHIRAGLSKEEILALPGVQASLRYEPRIISLHTHRTHKVRHESRHAQLAYAFLRGRDYAKTEDKPISFPNWDKVEAIAKRFSQEDERHLAQRFEQWAQEGSCFIRGREILAKRQFRKEAVNAF